MATQMTTPSNPELNLTEQLRVQQMYDFLHAAVHDLKNPLTTIPVRADLIKLKKDDPDMIDKMCDQIKTASLSMVRIIDELLQMGTMEAGKVNLMLIKLPLVDLVKQVIAMNFPLADRKNQTISFTAEVDPYVQADENKLTEVFDNLINNAIKYSPEGAAITVSMCLKADQVAVSVQDEGPGFTEEDKQLLFQRFTRLSAQPTGGENSTGLGLSIAKGLVEAHGGKLFAESEGKGATFTVELPVRR